MLLYEVYVKIVFHFGFRTIVVYNGKNLLSIYQQIIERNI